MITAIAIIAAIGGSLTALLFLGFLATDLMRLLTGWQRVTGTVVEVTEDVSSEGPAPKERWRVRVDGTDHEHVFAGMSGASQVPFALELLRHPRRATAIALAPHWWGAIIPCVVGAVVAVAGILWLNAHHG